MAKTCSTWLLRGLQRFEVTLLLDTLSGVESLGLRCAGCLQVGYCQGMAFVAGVLLMFVPEEPAWQLLVRLMAEDAVGMRDLFAPGEAVSQLACPRHASCSIARPLRRQ